VDELMREEHWSPYFRGFRFPYMFCSPEQYRRWLPGAGLEARRVELIEKDMRQEGEAGLAGWVRTTWLPYTERVPEKERERFIEQLVHRYLERFPEDRGGLVHVRMVRLEVEAVKP